MLTFVNYIHQILNHKYFFGVRNLRDLYTLLEGSYIARLYYGSLDTQFDKFLFFSAYIRDVCKIDRDVTWPKIIDLYVEDDKDSVNIFREHFDNYFEMDEDYSRSGGMADFSKVEKVVEGCCDFASLMSVINTYRSVFGVRDIEDFDRLYVGFLTYTNFSRGEGHFTPILEPGFINFHVPGCEFSKYAGEYLSVREDGSYLLKIKYGAPPDRELDLFFQLLSDYRAHCSAKS